MRGRLTILPRDSHRRPYRTANTARLHTPRLATLVRARSIANRKACRRGTEHSEALKAIGREAVNLQDSKEENRT
ncbi:unnamed protein product [Brassica rapa subsp. narinosa]